MNIQKSSIKYPNFIGSWTIKPINLCDEIINYFDQNPSNHSVGALSKGAINLSAKDRKDISISPNIFANDDDNIFSRYFSSLSVCLRDYGNQWPFLKQTFNSFDVGCFNVGKYKEGQHFGRVHTERGFNSMEREFAFMTYLSDDMKGGETYFVHYDLAIKPQKGLTLIWPAMWTHAHKGNTVTEGEKYIITGWLDLAS